MRYMNNNGWSDFKNLLTEGLAGESVFQKYLELEGYTNITHIDEAMSIDESLSASDWDLKGTLNDNEVTFEVKTQNTCEQYAGVNIEETQSGEDSGLRTTTADWFVFVNPVLGFGFVSVEALLELSEGSVRKFTTKSNNKATGFILPHSEILWTNNK